MKRHWKKNRYPTFRWLMLVATGSSRPTMGTINSASERVKFYRAHRYLKDRPLILRGIGKARTV